MCDDQAKATLQGADTVTEAMALDDWRALSHIIETVIIETDEPDRVRWEGVWYDGPLATAYLRTLRVIKELADRNLAAAPTAEDRCDQCGKMGGGHHPACVIYTGEPMPIASAQDDNGVRIEGVWDELQSLLPQTGVGAELEAAWDRLQCLLRGEQSPDASGVGK